jgi:hypothetical protein
MAVAINREARAIQTRVFGMSDKLTPWPLAPYNLEFEAFPAPWIIIGSKRVIDQISSELDVKDINSKELTGSG